MTQNKNNLYGYAMSKFLPTNEFKWIDLKEFDSNKYSSNSSKGVLEVDLEYPQELRKLHNDYPLKKMLSNYKLKIADFYNVPIGTVKKIHRVLQFSQFQWLKPYV